MIATTQQVSTGRNGERMDRTVRGVTLPRESQKPRSAYDRACEYIALELGIKVDTVKDQMNMPHSIHAKAAVFNRGLLKFGCTDKLAEVNSHIEASFLGERVPESKDARASHDVADAEEDVEQAAFRQNPCAETWERWRVKLCKESYRLQDVIASHDEEYR
jgi:hypothetical protein